MHMSRIYGDFTEEEESFYAIFASFFFIYEYESSERLTNLNIYFLVTHGPNRQWYIWREPG